jgi:hypothetical protein
MQLAFNSRYWLNKHDYITKAFLSLPNGFIIKGRCGIGGTRLEILNKLRSSIIVVPTVNIIKSKLIKHPEIIPIHGEVTDQEIREQLSKRLPAQKIMITPDSFGRLVKIGIGLGLLTDFYRNWYVLLDECHTFITEAFRPNILRPFNYFWEFDNKAIISATPYYFSDPRFLAMDKHEIIITEKLATITLLNCKSVYGTLNHLLVNADKLDGNLHIFLNSVTDIKKAIIAASITDCNIYCADDEKGKNLATLGELDKFFVSVPVNGEYKKINFYTSRYFEGWDMEDEGAHLILVTDCHKPQLKIGVHHKGVQVFGRGRPIEGLKDQKPYKFVHLTNHLNIRSLKDLNSLTIEYKDQADYIIKGYNNGSRLIKKNNMNLFCDIDSETKTPTLNYMKLDQQINEAYCTETYNHIDFLTDNWDKSGFTVKNRNAAHKLETTTTMNRKSASDQLKDDYLALLEDKENKNNGTAFNLIDIQELIRKSNPLAIEAFELLTPKEMEGTKYNVGKVRELIALKGNESKEAKLLMMLNTAFTVGRKYMTEQIKRKLQSIYNQLEIRDGGGKIKIATAKQLEEPGRFEIKACKVKNILGKWEHGYTILRAQFQVRMAA